MSWRGVASRWNIQTRANAALVLYRCHQEDVRGQVSESKRESDGRMVGRSDGRAQVTEVPRMDRDRSSSMSQAEQAESRCDDLDHTASRSFRTSGSQRAGEGTSKCKTQVQVQGAYVCVCVSTRDPDVT